MSNLPVPLNLNYGYVPPGAGVPAGPSGLPVLNMGPTQGMSVLTGQPMGALGPGPQVGGPFNFTTNPQGMSGVAPSQTFAQGGVRPMGALPPAGGTTTTTPGYRPSANPLGARTINTGLRPSAQMALGPGRMSAAQRAAQFGRQAMANPLATARGIPTALQSRGFGFRPGVGLATSVAAPLVGNALENVAPGDYGVLDQFIRGASTSAGFGAFLGPKGAAIAAGVGGLGNVIGNAFGVDIFGGGGDDEAPADPREQLDTYLGSVPISTEAQRNIREAFEMEMMFAEESEDPDAARALALQNAQEAIQGYWATEQQAEQQAEQAMAFQMAAQQYMAPHLNNMNQTQDAFSDYIESIADTLPVEYQSIARLTAGQGRNATARTTAAYANQIATMGQTNAIQQYYGDVQNMAAQQLSSNIAQGVGGGGQLNMTDLLLQSQMAEQ